MNRMSCLSRRFSRGGCPPHSRRRSGCPPTAAASLGSYAAMVRHYIVNYREAAAHEMAVYSRSSLDAAVLCRTESGTRHSHQCRIPQTALEMARDRLRENMPLPAYVRDFGSLLSFVESVIRPIWKIGDLAVYDIAHRIGAQNGIVPDRIYLHAGARLGAAALGLRGKSIADHELPPAFQRLTAAECEDCLCIYREDLRRIADRQPGRVAS